MVTGSASLRTSACCFSSSHQTSAPTISATADTHTQADKGLAHVIIVLVR
jgi:hypothetical protein